ncbi:MAG TPA: diacylglycerol kinase family protein [Chthoniobacteraceae bacterium]|nr:diacylglycerol kinase family protein [Chthoniobacteraceae bacterium]
MEDILVILNPAARSERARNVWDRIQSLPRAKVRPTEGPGDAQRFAREAAEAGVRTVVAAGGDGTINDVVNGLAGSDTSLAILPVGTMNVFAAEMGLPNDLEEAWEIIESGYTRSIDLAQANGHFFVQLAGIGFDAQVVERTSWNFKKNFGPLSYLVSAAQIAAEKPPRIKVESAGKSYEGSFVLIGNGRFYGAPIKVFKDAKLDDGLLDVVILKNLGYLELARFLTGVFTGTHTLAEDVEYFQAPSVRVESEDEVPVEVDGELMGKLPVEFRIAAKLKVVVDYS